MPSGNNTKQNEVRSTRNHQDYRLYCAECHGAIDPGHGYYDVTSDGLSFNFCFICCGTPVVAKRKGKQHAEMLGA